MRRCFNSSGSSRSTTSSEASVREPARELIRTIAPRIREISTQLLVSDNKVGGSLMRIHRDVRFAKDKTPYKTNAGIHFRHAAGKDIHAPGLYLHLSVDEVFLGAGMWRPDAQALGAVRRAIVGNPTAYKRARDDKAFRKHWELRGTSLKRVPKGYDAEHPLVEDLKLKDHIAVADLKPDDVTKAGFVERVADLFTAAKPYMRWEAKALDLAF
jgi:uncharacterized protein (TIGR02453 family)